MQDRNVSGIDCFGFVMVPGIDCSGTEWAQEKIDVGVDNSEYRVPWQ